MTWDAFGVLADIVLVVATLLLGAVAIFAALWPTSIRPWFRKPRLKLEVGNGPPMSLAARIGPVTRSMGRDGWIPNYECRIRVTNEGRDAATDVEVFAQALRRRNDDGTFEPCTWLPMNLAWSDLPRNAPATFLPRIAPSMHRFCGLGHVIEPRRLSRIGRALNQGIELPDELPNDNGPVFSFHIITKTNIKQYLVPPGVYELDVVAASDNADPVYCTVVIELTGWSDDEREMLGGLLKVGMRAS